MQHEAPEVLSRPSKGRTSILAGVMEGVGGGKKAAKETKVRAGFTLEPVVLQENCFQGRLHRSRITGSVVLGDERAVPDEYDLGVVDLRDREATDKLEVRNGVNIWSKLLVGNALEKDLYMFKVSPLLYRSWIAQGRYAESCKSDLSTTYADVVEKVLASPVNDLNHSMGRSSPVQLWALLLFPAQFLGDLSMVLRVVVVFCILVCVAERTNTAFRYRWERPLTLPLRLWTTFDMLAIVASFGDLLRNKQYATLMGGFAAFCICLYDHTIDCSAVVGYWSDAKFVILQNLGGNVYLCERKTWEMEGVTDRVHSKLKQLVPGARKPAFILSVEGLVCELLPVEPSDWNAARRAQETVWALHLPLFGDLTTTWSAGYVPKLESSKGPSGAAAQGF